ncbi:response regulator [Christiangramia fulva]|uniref:Response regulator n=1 Tax=Christiangramia fulva TaxID=2126553 RepID=A0A2R3Z9E5_9FLAO|nr:response regulator [Christiangramia fulva]AVR46876.1 response regulator [Christiangramia fulva]
MLRTIIVDDDKIVTFLQKKMVAKSDLDPQPYVFEKGRDALNFLTEESDPDTEYLILLDINMPNMNGWEFLDELEKIRNKENCHVVMVTSSIDRKDKLKAANNNLVVDYIEKPVSARHCAKLKGITKLSVHF